MSSSLSVQGQNCDKVRLCPSWWQQQQQQSIVWNKKSKRTMAALPWTMLWVAETHCPIYWDMWTPNVLTVVQHLGRNKQRNKHQNKKSSAIAASRRVYEEASVHRGSPKALKCDWGCSMCFGTKRGRPGILSPLSPPPSHALLAHLCELQSEWRAYHWVVPWEGKFQSPFLH